MPGKWVIPLSSSLFFFFLKKEENLAFTFLFYVNIWHVLGKMIHEELGFSNTQLSCWERVPFKCFILDKSTTSPFLEKRFGILFVRVEKFMIKWKKSIFGCQRTHKEKTFKWVRHLNQKYAKYFQLLRNLKKQRLHFPGTPFILLKGKILELAISLGIGESMSYIGWGGVQQAPPRLSCL